MTKIVGLIENLKKDGSQINVFVNSPVKDGKLLR